MNMSILYEDMPSFVKHHCLIDSTFRVLRCWVLKSRLDIDDAMM